MARCEDFPCCGHENGCCPDFDESGRQLNMVCTCGAKLPVNARYSICDACFKRGGEEEGPDDLDGFESDYHPGNDEDLDPLDDDRDQNNPVESADWDRIYSDPDYDMDHDHGMDY